MFVEVWDHVFCFVFKILFIHDKEIEIGRDIGRGRSRLQAESPICTEKISSPGLDPRTLSQRQRRSTA